jgi:hypothetical protein
MPDVDELLRGDGVTVVPAAVVLGGGGGGGDSEDNGGGGFGLVARPVGAYVIRGDSVPWQPAADPARGWQVLAGLAVLATWSIGRRMVRR